MDPSFETAAQKAYQEKPSDFYVGPSMHPTLKPLDRLKLINYGARKVRSGDVIVFRSPINGRRLTHRVTKSNADGVMTRGDNNPQRDPWMLSHEKILGQVVSARRNGSWIPVHGGLKGRIRAAEIKFIRHIALTIYRLTQGVYRKLTAYHPLRLKLPIRKIFRTISFQRQEGVEFQALIGSRLVARQSGHKGPWQLCKPYTWFLNEQSLPDPPSSSDKENMRP